LLNSAITGRSLTSLLALRAAWSPGLTTDLVVNLGTSSDEPASWLWSLMFLIGSLGKEGKRKFDQRPEHSRSPRPRVRARLRSCALLLNAEAVARAGSDRLAGNRQEDPVGAAAALLRGA
jgi:hypothetical protein